MSMIAPANLAQEDKSLDDKIISALLKDDLEAIKKLKRFRIKHLGKRNIFLGTKTPVFHLACQYSSLEVVKELLPCKKFINKSSATTKCTPLLQICKYGNPKKKQYAQVIEYLLSLNPDIKAEDLSGNTASHYFAQYGNSLKLEQLLNLGAEINHKNAQGLTPLHLAIMHRKNSILEIRRRIKQYNKREIKLDSSGIAYIKSALNNPVIPLLIDRGADINARDKYNETPLHKACRTMDTISIGLLIDAGADVTIKDKRGQTPLHYLLNNGRASDTLIGMVTNMSLMEELDKQGKTAFHYKVEKGTYKEVVSMGKNLDIQKLDTIGTSLFSSLTFSRKDTYKKAEYLLKHVDPNYLSSRNRHSAIHYALFCREDSLIHLLANHGADLNSKNKNGLTPIMRATELGKVNKVKELIKLGANVDSIDVTGRSALFLAVQHNNYEITEALLLAGANPAVRVMHGWSLMHMAALTADLKLVKLLVKHNVPLNLYDSKGNTPLEVAIHGDADYRGKTTSGNPEIIQYLKDVGAKNK